MDRFALFFMRLVMITIGFILASVAAGVALAFLTHIVTPQEAADLTGPGRGSWLLLATIVFASATGAVAFFPAIVVILYSEFTRRQDWLYYAIAGGLIAVIAPMFITLLQSSGRPTNFEFMAMSLAAGMIGGIAYWLVSGRNAGNWLPDKS